MTNADNTDEWTFLANTPDQAKSPLSLEQVAEDIGLYINANKKSPLSGRSLKLGNEFSYFGSNISSIKSDISIRWAKGVDCHQQVINHMEVWSPQ